MTPHDPGAGWRAMLMKKVPVALVVDQPVRIVLPAGQRREMKLRPMRLRAQDGGHVASAGDKIVDERTLDPKLRDSSVPFFSGPARPLHTRPAPSKFASRCASPGRNGLAGNASPVAVQPSSESFSNAASTTRVVNVFPLTTALPPVYHPSPPLLATPLSSQLSVDPTVSPPPKWPTPGRRTARQARGDVS